MDNTEFRRVAHRFVEWIADYYENLESYPVSAQIKPGDVLERLKKSPPDVGESIEDIFLDFERTIVPGITHWQHPHFYGSYPAQSTYPSLLAEMLSSAVSSQSASWQYSPAATELELRVTDWLRQLLGLPDQFTGTTQESVATSTLTAILTARDKWSQYHVSQKGLYKQKRFVVYASNDADPELNKVMRISGLGEENLSHIALDEQFAMDPKALSCAIEKDKEKGLVPLMVIATLGAQSTQAIDPLQKIGVIARKHKMWIHVDAAYAGAAMALPEYQYLRDLIQNVHSIVIDPHKWLLTSTDCSVYFVKDLKALQKTLGTLVHYIPASKNKSMAHFNSRGLTEGRRFRALKLWFVLREYGTQGVQRFIRNHVKLAKQIEEKILRSPDFKLMAPVNFNVVCFRYIPAKAMKDIEIDSFNHQLLDRLNASGRIFLSPVDLKNQYALRLVIGQTYATKESLNIAWQRIVTTAELLSAEH